VGFRISHCIVRETRKHGTSHSHRVSLITRRSAAGTNKKAPFGALIQASHLPRPASAQREPGARVASKLAPTTSQIPQQNSLP
jgi:hypothetical protein